MVLFYSSLAISYQGVSIGGGTGSISDILDASQLICEKVCLLLPILSENKISITFIILLIISYRFSVRGWKITCKVL